LQPNASPYPYIFRHRKKEAGFSLKTFSQASVAVFAPANEVLNYAKCVTKCDLSAGSGGPWPLAILLT